MLLSLLLALLIAALACVFALQNTAPIAVSFLAWRLQGSLALVLLATFALGTAVGLLACLPALARERWAARDLRKRLDESQTSSPEPEPGEGSGGNDDRDRKEDEDQSRKGG